MSAGKKTNVTLHIEDLVKKEGNFLAHENRERNLNILTLGKKCAHLLTAAICSRFSFGSWSQFINKKPFFTFLWSFLVQLCDSTSPPSPHCCCHTAWSNQLHCFLSPKQVTKACSIPTGFWVHQFYSLSIAAWMEINKTVSIWQATVSRLEQVTRWWQINKTDGSVFLAGAKTAGAANWKFWRQNWMVTTMTNFVDRSLPTTVSTCATWVNSYPSHHRQKAKDKTENKQTNTQVRRVQLMILIEMKSCRIFSVFLSFFEIICVLYWKVEIEVFCWVFSQITQVKSVENRPKYKCFHAVREEKVPK